jgi:polyferredoxin
MLLPWKGEGMESSVMQNRTRDLENPGGDSAQGSNNARPIKILPQMLTRFRTEATIARIRALVQLVFAVFCLFVGYRFYQFYSWMIGQSDVYATRPSSVEGFLPIGALLGFKRLLLTGKWDEVHPAGLTIFISAILLAILFRKGFCGWICPVGFASNVLEKLGRKLNWARSLPRWLDYPLLGLKYLLLGFFGYVILWKMNVPAIEAFLFSQYNLVSDAKMLLFFLYPSALTLQVLGILVLVSLAVRNFWCRYLCPYGALLGLGALLSPLKVKRNASLCVDCKRCDKICPAAIRISPNQTIRHPECIGCMECIEVCPQKDCLVLAGPGRNPISIFRYPVMVVGFFVLIWAIALTSGHWHTHVSPEVFRALYPAASSLLHP